MKIAVVGSGGLGGYYGGLLARAGHEVTFIARGMHLAALQTKGLAIKSIYGDFHVAPVRAVHTPQRGWTADLVLMCVKTPTLEDAARLALPMVAADTVVMGLQNGIDAAERIGAVVGMERVLAGVTWISAAIEAPGVIRQLSTFRRIVLGEPDGGISPRVERIVEALSSMGITVEASGAIRKVLWTKFVFISGFSAVGAATRLAVGDYRSVPETRAMMVRLMREVAALAGADGVSLDLNVVDQALSIIDGADPAMKPSMQRDVEAGRPSELESVVGIVVRKGSRVGVPTLAADMLYANLLPGELKARTAVS